MNTLAVESANGTYQDDTDRANLNLEIEALKSEIDRIANSTNFNQINLLDGTIGQSLKLDSTSSAAFGADKLASISVSGGKLAAADKFNITIAADTGKVTFAGTSDTSDNVASWTIKDSKGTVITADDTLKAGETYTATATMGTAATSDNTAKYKTLEVTFTTGAEYAVKPSADVTYVADVTKDGLQLQIGSENKEDQRVSLTVADMSQAGLKISDISIATQTEAREAITTIKNAINTVSATRANLGALQNRLEHTTNNLSTMSENLTSAESSIRDVDMSDEYVQYSKNQILSQAATAMLTQANAQPQNVLSLLKS